jgi:hypothetical protein
VKNILISISFCILFLVSSLKAQEIATTPTLTPKTDSLRKVKEFGFGFTGLQSISYSMQYRWGNTKRLFRVNGTIGSTVGFGNGFNSSTIGELFNSNTTTINSTTYSPLGINTAGLSFGVLYLKNLVKNFGIMYGPMVGLTCSTAGTQTVEVNTSTGNLTNTTINTHTKTIQPYIGFALGMFYKINKSFFLYAEITPNIYYARTNSKPNSTSNLNSNTNLINTTSNTSSSNNTFGMASLSNSLATLTIVYRITGSTINNLHL